MLEKGLGIDKFQIGAGVGVADCGKWKPHWKIEKYNQNGELYAVEEFDGNSLLTKGVEVLWKAACNISGYRPFNSEYARIGVGDSTVETTPDMAGLQGTNKAYAQVDSVYPQVQGNTVTFRATFGAGTAGFDWQEFVIDNGVIALNRKIEYHGTKAASDIWVVSCSIAIV